MNHQTAWIESAEPFEDHGLWWLRATANDGANTYTFAVPQVDGYATREEAIAAAQSLTTTPGIAYESLGDGSCGR